MVWELEQALDIFLDENNDLLLKGKWGIERETQRVDVHGDLALTEHPVSFGDKMKNPEITTDFSESQLELITPPFDTVEETYEYLEKLHDIVEKELKNELLWPMSMPPRLPDEEKIPIAKFNDSTEGREKEIYRLGLGKRYGRKMQMISGIHFNFSYGDELLDVLYKHFGDGMDRGEFNDKAYFAMARNFLRYRWLLIYLFGASPTIDCTYDSVVKKEFSKIRKCCPECCNSISNYDNYVTSLRVSRFGYSNAVQGKFSVSFDSKNDYIQGIRKMLATKSKEFEKIGVYQNGAQIQLNDNILQKESEFYSPIRLKQVTQKGETQLDAIEKRGVKYAEVRILDVNPFEKTGISLNQMRFMQVFMMFCLLEGSDFINKDERKLMNKNHHLVALRGRKRGLKLYKKGSEKIELTKWGSEIFSKLLLISKHMDMESKRDYTESVLLELKKLADPSLLPSSMIQNEMKQKGLSFIEYGLKISNENKYNIIVKGDFKNVEGL